MSFEHAFECSEEEVTYFALTYPFSYQDCQEMLDQYEDTYTNHPRIYFHRELLTTSTEGRRIDLLTITAQQKGLTELEEDIEDLFPEKRRRPLKFDKPVIFVTARVHPGETQGSHMMNGLLNFLLKEYL
jgi:hypothetical protein